MANAIPYDESDPEYRLIKSVDDAWHADLQIIRQITLQEMREEEDRKYAASLAGVTVEDNPEHLRRLAMLVDDQDDQEDDDEQEVENENGCASTNNSIKSFQSSNTFSPSTINPYAQKQKKKCTICMEFVTRTDPRVPCKHAYCIQCLQDLFMRSMQDETLMPPRCCQQEIPIHLTHFSVREIDNFKLKHVEFSTKNRLYCSISTCSAFIPPSSIVDDIGTCPKPNCRVQTCFICKGPSHGKLDCPKDEATATILAVANEAGWARCYQCRAMVELSHGCYHMTCRCRAEFCYVCCVPWKNCTCPQWDEQFLYEEARARTARVTISRGANDNNELNFARRVENMMNQLRANHECEHKGRWTYVRGGGQCEECSNYLPIYLYRCNRCQFMACNRCRRNRL